MGSYFKRGEGRESRVELDQVSLCLCGLVRGVFQVSAGFNLGGHGEHGGWAV
jgi:hypothetical protein